MIYLLFTQCNTSVIFLSKRKGETCIDDSHQSLKWKDWPHATSSHSVTEVLSAQFHRWGNPGGTSGTRSQISLISTVLERSVPLYSYRTFYWQESSRVASLGASSVRRATEWETILRRTGGRMHTASRSLGKRLLSVQLMTIWNGKEAINCRVSTRDLN